MSKNVKYYSSDHFGAPVIKGDRWGYLVEMLRKVLVEGFNERTDLTEIKVVNSNTIEAKFGTAHNYSVDQTIAVTGASYPELNIEYFVSKVNGLIVTCKSYEDTLTGLVGQTLAVNAKAKVTPCGFIEKFKDGNRSVFTTDEQEAFFYIDDRDGGAYWKEASNSQTAGICPIVFMTDKMSDIDTVTGRYIVPYDSSNPDFYKKVDYVYPGNTTTGSARGAAMGLWNFISFGLITNTSAVRANSIAQQQTVVKWKVIGNGRLFYLIITVMGANTPKQHIFSFGKIKSSVKKEGDLPYLLFASPMDTSINMASSYSYRRFNLYGSYTPYHNLWANNGSGYPWPNTDIGRTNRGILSINKKPSECLFMPTVTTRFHTANIFIVSGLYGNYPDQITKKYNIESIKIMNSVGDYIGILPGLMWTYNSSNVYNADGLINTYRYGNKIKRMYNFNDMFNNSNVMDANNSAGVTFIYNISFNYEDWNNYE